MSCDISTLLVAGDYDPIKPPDTGPMAAETLSQRYFYSFRGFGDSIYCDCYDAVADAFLADPLHVPDSSCVDAFSPLQFVPPAT